MCVVIGVSGASGSGKSTFSKELLNLLPNCAYLSADKYYKEELPKMVSPLDGKTYPDWNHPSAIDEKGVLNELFQVKKQYDYVIVDGAFIFCIPQILCELNYKIFVDASIEMRLFRRISRNVIEKNQSVEFIGGYYLSCVRYREKEFSLPSKKYADLVVDNENGFGTMTETAKNNILNLK